MKEDHLGQALRTAIEADVSRDRLKLMLVEHPESATDIEELFGNTTEHTIQSYRVLVHLLIDQIEDEKLRKRLLSQLGRKAQKSRRAPYRNPELEAAVIDVWKKDGSKSGGQIALELESRGLYSDQRTVNRILKKHRDTC